MGALFDDKTVSQNDLDNSFDQGEEREPVPQLLENIFPHVHSIGEQIDGQIYLCLSRIQGTKRTRSTACLHNKIHAIELEEGHVLAPGMLCRDPIP